jgi:hypothetical protein
MLKNDGDIVRGLGFVALYSAYLEEQIDNLLTKLGQVEEYNENKQRWPISRKIKHAIKIIEKFESTVFLNLVANLQTCIGLFEDRNKLIHGRIYANFDRPETLKSGRPNILDREAHSEELYKLANEFDAFREAIYRELIIKIPNAVDRYLKSDV